MDRFIQKLSMTLAGTTTRRDFLARLARGAVTVGLGAVGLFAGNRETLAQGGMCMKMFARGNCPENACTLTLGSPCSGAPNTICPECTNTFNRTTCPPAADGTVRKPIGYWACCCPREPGQPNRVSYCYRCSPKSKTDANFCKCVYHSNAACSGGD